MQQYKIEKFLLEDSRRYSFIYIGVLAELIPAAPVIVQWQDLLIALMLARPTEFSTR